ncbi:hypothetical protein [Streptomyces sp. NBC_00212]|uniref:hypothetical protein n=1 Tax=Streptomyces sp. NBC_00212 TaxID=2975684 RepID=UPI003244FCE0
MTSPDPASARAGQAAVGYLNLHGCAYNGGLTTVTPISNNAPAFDSGTNVSNTPDTATKCGPGVGPSFPVIYQNSGFKALDLSSGRYLNLHGCAYNGGLTTVTPISNSSPAFDSGTNVSNTPDTALKCGGGVANFPLIPQNSGFKVLDLSSGRYLNLHGCAYNGGSTTVTTVTTVSNNAPAFDSGTNVSNTPDTALKCGPGVGNFPLSRQNSGFKVLDLSHS